MLVVYFIVGGCSLWLVVFEWWIGLIKLWLENIWIRLFCVFVVCGFYGGEEGSKDVVKRMWLCEWLKIGSYENEV